VDADASRTGTGLTAYRNGAVARVCYLGDVEGPTPRASRGRRGPAVIILAAAWLFAACSANAPATLSPTDPPALTPVPVFTAAPTPAEVADSSEPSTDPEVTPSDSPLASPGPAASCTGTDANKEFYVTVAVHVTWDVFCPVLPKGWIVEAGSYRTSSGGWLKIAYKASGGRRFELREGAFCTDPATCVPTGTELAPGSFGDREATILQVEDGGFAALVGRGQKFSWAAIGKGMDEPTFRAYAQALIVVAD
jgi:hypothetical protein